MRNGSDARLMRFIKRIARWSLKKRYLVQRPIISISDLSDNFSKILKLLAHPRGFEPLTSAFGGQYGSELHCNTLDFIKHHQNWRAAKVKNGDAGSARTAPSISNMTMEELVSLFEEHFVLFLDKHIKKYAQHFYKNPPIHKDLQREAVYRLAFKADSVESVLKYLGTDRVDLSKICRKHNFDLKTRQPLPGFDAGYIRSGEESILIEDNDGNLVDQKPVKAKRGKSKRAKRQSNPARPRKSGVRVSRKSSSFDSMLAPDRDVIDYDDNLRDITIEPVKPDTSASPASRKSSKVRNATASKSKGQRKRASSRGKKTSKPGSKAFQRLSAGSTVSDMD